jgi:hypothetical protein
MMFEVADPKDPDESLSDSEPDITIEERGV